MKSIFLSLALLPVAAAASAQTVVDCDWRASAHAIVEPWEENTSTFSNGAVRLVHLDTTEPIVGAASIVVLSPPYDELGFRQCKVVTLNEDIGFARVYWPSLSAGYDPARGLLFDVNVDVYDPATEQYPTVGLSFSLNQSTGVIVPVLGKRIE